MKFGVVGSGWAATAHIAAINATTRGRGTAVCSSRPLDDKVHSMKSKADKGQDMPLTSFPEAKKTFDVIFAADKSAAQGGASVTIS